METNDKTVFLAVIQYLSLNFPDRAVTPDLVSSYFHDLREFSIQDVDRAARTFVRTGDKFPFVSDLISIIS